MYKNNSRRPSSPLPKWFKEEYKFESFVTNSINKQLWKYKLLESQHLHEPGNTIYRYQVSYIIDDIIFNYKRKKFIQFLNDDYKVFTYNYPFQNDEIFVGLENLSIYVNWETNSEDAYLYNIKYENKQLKNILIVIYMPKSYENILEIKEFLYECLPHELQHAMDNVYDKLQVETAGNLNELNYQLKNIINWKNVDKSGIFKKTQIDNIDSFLFLITEFIYRTQKSEIHAYLESFYNEFKQNIKTKEFFETQNYKYYEYLKNNIDEILNNYNYYQSIYGLLMQKICQALKKIQNNGIKKNYSFKHLLKFWKDRINIFLEKADKINKKHFKL